MGKLKKFIMNKIEKVNVQVSMLTCGLIIFSCLVIYLVTSGVMISMLADAYNERANLTFTTIESHFDSRLFTEDVPDGVYGAALSYLSAVKDNMAISEIFVVRKDKNGDFQYILNTKNDKINTVINDEKITGKIEKEIFVVRKDKNGDFQYILNTKNDKINTVINDEKITGKIEKEINDLYTTHYADAGAFYASLDGFRYLNFYPIMDGGTVKGVACIGIDANRVYIFKIILRVIVIILILLCCVISVRFSMAIFKRISNPLYQDMSNTDTLTGLKNKNSFTVDMHNIESGNQSRYAIVTVDLNELKNINDSRGHQMGDIYIQNGADAIRKAMEGTDFIGYRVGGDEFSVVLKDCDIDMIKNFADRIARMADSINRGGIKTSMSIGYAKFDAEKDRNFSMTMERADAMMYENKRLYYKTKNLKRREE